MPIIRRRSIPRPKVLDSLIDEEIVKVELYLSKGAFEETKPRYRRAHKNIVSWLFQLATFDWTHPAIPTKPCKTYNAKSFYKGVWKKAPQEENALEEFLYHCARQTKLRIDVCSYATTYLQNVAEGKSTEGLEESYLAPYTGKRKEELRALMTVEVERCTATASCVKRLMAFAFKVQENELSRKNPEAHAVHHQLGVAPMRYNVALLIELATRYPGALDIEEWNYWADQLEAIVL